MAEQAKKDKKRPPLSIITIPKDKMGVYIKKFWGVAEQVIVGTEVETLKSTGGKDSRVLFITTAAVYVFKNKFSGVELSRNFTVYDLNKVAYIEPDTLIISYGIKEVVFRTENALHIGTILLMQHACNYYNVPNASALKVESTPANALNYQKCPVRPLQALQTRLITISHFYKKPFPQSLTAQFKEWDQQHAGTLSIDSNFYSGNATEAITHAIAWDSDIKTLNLKGYAVEQVDKVIQKIFLESFAIINLHFIDYTNPIDVDLDLTSREETQISTVQFKNCHPSLVFRFFKNLYKFNGRLKAISLENCNLGIQEWSEIMSAIQKFPCFMKLATIVIDNINMKQVPARMLCQTITKNRTLTNIQISNISDDISDFISTLFNGAKTFTHLIVDHCTLKKQLSTDTAPNLTYINFSYSVLSPSFFTSLIQALGSRKNARPTMLDLSSLQTDFESLFSSLSGVEIVPVINDIIIDNNTLTPKAVPHFLKFLESQKPILQYISLAGCMTEVLGVVLPALLAILKEGILTGFDISAGKEGIKSTNEYLSFITALSQVPTLRSLNVSNAPIGDKGMEILINLAKNNANLEEIGADGIGISSVDKFCSYYNNLCELNTIKYIAFPRKEQASLNIKKETATAESKATLVAVKKKKNMQSATQRLAVYERIEYDDNEGVVEPGEVRKAKTNPLDDLDAVILQMVNSICEVEPSEFTPEETAKLIMDNITTSARTLSSELTGSHKKVGAIFRS